MMLKVIDLEKNYGNVHALRGLSLEIHQGEFVSIMGKSGCGKSTLLHCMSGILKPTSGEIIFNGQSLYTLNDDKRAKIRREAMGFVFQFFNLIPELTVKENILLPIKINRLKLDEVYYERLIEDLGLSEFINRLPSTLSGGQQQRVAIARALIHKPAIVFAPTLDFIFWRIVSIVLGLKKTSFEISSVVLSSARSLRIRNSFSENLTGLG